MSGGALLAMVVLLVLNGFFVAAEFAFTAASRHDLVGRPTRAARWAVKSIDELSFTLAGAQLGITIASLGIGAVAEPAVAALIEAGIGSVVELPSAVLHTIALIISLLIVVFLHMVIGEMAPKNIAIATPEAAALAMAYPFRIYAGIFRPAIWFLNGLANGGLRLVGIDPDEIGDVHTADDLASMITAGRREGVVEEFAHRLLTGAIDLGGLEAYHVMVPRPDVVALSRSSTLADIEATVVDRGTTRIPVFGTGLDDIHGFVHAKDLLGVEAADLAGPIPDRMIRELLVVPESARVDRLLEDMRRNRNHLALVIDEHGGTAGIVTMEDIVEEVVGEIRDEHDIETGRIRRAGPNRWIVDAAVRPAEVHRACGVRLPEGEFDTISGLVMERIGRIPVVGDQVEDEEWTVRVRSMEGRRVGEVELIGRKATTRGSSAQE